MDESWADAIKGEYGEETKIEVDTKVEDDKKDENIADDIDKKIEGEGDKKEDDKKEDDKKEDEDKDKKADETDEEKVAREAKEAENADIAKKAEEDKVQKEEKFATKDDIKAALKEVEVEKKTFETTHKALEKEVLEKLYPEGIDRQLRDSEGDPITSIDDLTKLINPKTKELFTEEEAGSWLLASQQKLNKDIEQLERYAADIVDTNLALKDGADRVEKVYGDLLKSMPEKAKSILEAYDKTLVKDPKTNIVIKAPVDVVDFYNLALAPYKEAADKALADKEAKDKADAEAAKAKAEADAKAEQEDRGDVSQKGKSKLPLSDTDDEWSKAYESYFNE